MRIGADDFIAKAMAFKGQDYVWGGGHGGNMQGPGGVDCSGLVSQALQDAGLNVSGTAADLQDMGQKVGMDDLQKGDLVFIGDPATHVGIYLGDGKVLHASSGSDEVKVDDLADVGFDNAVRLPQMSQGDESAIAGGTGRKSLLGLG